MKQWATQNGYRVMRVLPGRCNVFAVEKGGSFILVDSSVPNVRRRLIKTISKLLSAGYSLRALVLTHAHFDHAGNAAALAQAFHVPVMISGEELELLRRGENAAIRGVMGLTRLANMPSVQKRLRRFGYEMEAHAMEMPADFAQYGLPGVTVLPTPGHTKGSASLLVDNEIALVGDTMHGVFPGNAWPPFAEDETQLLESWGKLLETGCGTFLPAHGGERSRGMAKIEFRRMRENSATRPRSSIEP